MELSVIISTQRDAASFLGKALIGYAAQSFRDFEIIIADDGYGPETQKIISHFQKEFKSVTHLGPDEHGTSKSEILNRAIQTSGSNYIVFTDANCIPRKDFLQVHNERREETFFLTGSQFKLPPMISQSIEDTHIRSQHCFDLGWLKQSGLRFSLKNQQLSKNRIKSNILNALTPGKATWNHHNVSCWKKDLLEVNGFDERMKAGGEEEELYARLLNNDIHGIKVHFNAICLHLNHPKALPHPKDLAMRAYLRKAAKRSNAIWTQYGIHKERAIPINVQDGDYS